MKDVLIPAKKNSMKNSTQFITKMFYRQTHPRQSHIYSILIYSLPRIRLDGRLAVSAILFPYYVVRVNYRLLRFYDRHYIALHCFYCLSCFLPRQHTGGMKNKELKRLFIGVFVKFVKSMVLQIFGCLYVI